MLDFQDLLSDKDLSDQIEEAFGNRPTSLGLVLIKNVPVSYNSRSYSYPLNLLYSFP